MDWLEKTWVAFLILLLTALVVLLSMAIIWSKSGRELAEEHLGGDVVCDADGLCIKSGVRYQCVTHRGNVACAQLGPLEGP